MSEDEDGPFECWAEGEDARSDRIVAVLRSLATSVERDDATRYDMTLTITETPDEEQADRGLDPDTMRLTADHNTGDAPVADHVRQIIADQTDGHSATWVTESSIRLATARADLPRDDVDAALARLVADGTLTAREHMGGMQYALTEEDA